LADVVIVGGGVIGCATAYYLSLQGANVVVLERGEIACEASGAAAGMLAALSGEAGERGPDFDALCLASQAMFASLVPELAATDIDIRHQRTGVMHVALTDARASDLKARFEFAATRGAKATWLEQAALLRAEPLLNPRAVAGYLTPNEQYVDPQRLTQALAEASRRRGVTIAANSPVERLRRSGRVVTSVWTPSATYHCDTLLLAAGPWTLPLAKRLGAHIPVRPVRGQMLSLNGPSMSLRHMIWGDHAYLVPREDGQTYVGATVEEVGYRKRTTTSGISRLRRGAAGLVPSLAMALQRRAWAGLRPASLDGMPVMGRLQDWHNVWVSTGHFRNGILLAPVSGELMARSILNGVADPMLAPFSPDRFLD
jgi:glycine oxidase